VSVIVPACVVSSFGAPLSGPPVSFAFQPIIDAQAQRIHSYEALVRGRSNESAGSVFAQVASADASRFDEELRQLAVALAASLGIACDLNLNFLPRSQQHSDVTLRATIKAAERCGLSIDRLVLEVTESEVIDDGAQFARVINLYRGMGLKIAIDDFGAGYAGLNLLADFQPDLVKLDMHLVRGIESNGPRQAIVRAILLACNDLGIDTLAEGVETLDEYHWFREHDVKLFQGYLFAKPAFEKLAEPSEIFFPPPALDRRQSRVA
jgi:EAL domain-containing protein (putative c-di-GMP-specific phosphodiesterase class I)